MMLRPSHVLRLLYRFGILGAVEGQFPGRGGGGEGVKLRRIPRNPFPPHTTIRFFAIDVNHSLKE
jgi:hypothetical protein